jgi:hypothetical protein
VTDTEKLEALKRALQDPDLYLGTTIMLTELHVREERVRRAKGFFWGKQYREQVEKEADEALRGAKAYDRLLSVCEGIAGVRS